MSWVVLPGIRAPRLMPLQDSFKRRPTYQQQPTAEQQRPSVTPLLGSPKLDDLRFSMQRAQNETGRPVILSWRSVDKQATFLLTVTSGPKPSVPPTWMLHQGTEENSVVVWVYTTADTELIMTLVEGVDGDRSGVKAEIPPSLKPIDPLTDPAALSVPLPHDEFADKYEILAHIGQGGMGMIYKARQKEARRLVALKVLHSHLLTDLESKRRFEQEASSCKALSHRNVLAVYEFGFSKHGQPYMTMEFLDGKSLSTLLTEQSRLELRLFINVFTQICDGLNYAHKQGLTHRDVKPSNIMICKNEAGVEFVKIVDFGIAKSHIQKNREQITPTGNVLGSPAYIAPEQCAGAEADPRSDIYSLGCVMYEALTGHPPFYHDNPIKVMMMQLSEPAPPFSLAAPDLEIPYDLEVVIMRCLEKDPAMRYQTAEEVGVDLWTFAATGQIQARPESSTHAQQSIAAVQSVLQLPPTAPAKETVHSADTVEAELPKAKTAQKKSMVMRFKRFRGSLEMDILWEGLLLARTLLNKGAIVTLVLDMESVGLVCKSEVVAARYHLDQAIVKKLVTMQSLLQGLIKNGAQVYASDRWAKHWSESPNLMPGVNMVSDEEMADLLLESSGSILDY